MYLSNQISLQLARCLGGLFSFGILAAFGFQTSAQSVSLDWFANPEPTIAGYKIYYGGQTGNYTNSIDVGNTTNATVSGLVGGASYYFVATAYDSTGQESAPSAEIGYDVPLQASSITSNLPPRILSLTDNGLTVELQCLVTPGGSYRLDHAKTLFPITWQEVRTFYPVDANLVITETKTSGQALGFYRLMELP